MRATSEFMSSLIKPTETQKTTTTTTAAVATIGSLPALEIMPAKGAVIDWQLNKPEMINVNTLSIHYTSLRDITFNSDSIVLYCHGGGSSPRTRMKNHLVEQAARAYLQPLNVETKHSTNFLPWNWQKLMSYTPLKFNMNMNMNLPTYEENRRSSEAPGCFFGLISSFVKRLSFSGTLKYLLGRVRQPVRFLQPRIY